MIFLEPNKPLPPDLLEEQARLGVLRTPVIAPLQGQERLIGCIARMRKCRCNGAAHHTGVRLEANAGRNSGKRIIQ